MKNDKKRGRVTVKGPSVTTEPKKYTIEELIQLGKERNSINLARPLYDKEKER